MRISATDAYGVTTEADLAQCDGSRLPPPFLFCGCWCNFFFTAPLSVQGFFTEGSPACLATDINEILYLCLIFLVEPSVSDIQTVAPTCPYFAEIYGRSLSIDRFQVSHFRPVVMDIEIGGRSKKFLGGQESAAVDQECMGSNASSHSFGLRLSLVGCLSLAGTGFLSGAADSLQ